MASDQHMLIRSHFLSERQKTTVGYLDTVRPLVMDGCREGVFLNFSVIGGARGLPGFECGEFLGGEAWIAAAGHPTGFDLTNGFRQAGF